MTFFGDVIIDAVCRADVLDVETLTSDMVIFIWSANAAEQLEAALDEAGWTLTRTNTMKTYVIKHVLTPEGDHHFTEETTGFDFSIRNAGADEAISEVRKSFCQSRIVSGEGHHEFMVDVITVLTPHHHEAALRGAMLQIDSLSYQLERLKHERDEAVKKSEIAEARAASAVKKAEFPNQRAKKIVETIQIYLGKVLGDNPMYGMNDPVRLAAEFQKELTKEYNLLWPEG